MSITTPISYWKLNESSGNASDSVGSNTGTNTSVTYSAGKMSNGADFNGTTSRLNIPTTGLAPTTAVSFSCWVKCSSYTTRQSLLVKSDGVGSSTTAFAFEVGNASGKSTMVISNGSSQVQTNSSASLTTGVWTHLAFTYDGTNQRLYIDGSLDTSNTSGIGNVNNITQTTALGYYGSLAGITLNGSLDEAGFWNVALTASEITDLYNSGNGKSYPFGTAYLYDVTSIAMTMTLNSIQTAIAYVREVSSIAMTMTINNVIFGYIYNFTVTSISMVLSINPVSWALKTWATFAKSATATVTNTAKSVSNWINQSKN